jgi:Protein of unknown function (DUF2950)
MNSNTIRMREKKMRIRITITNFFVITTLLSTHAAWGAEQKTFSTPAEAAKALVKAAAEGNQEEMLAVLGDEGKELVYSSDPVQDKTNWQRFAKSYQAKHSIVAEDDKTRILQVGANNWPMPIPIVNDGGKWRFDTAAGKQELLYRRIGRNELGAIGACRGYIDAQKDYAAVGHDGLPAGVYAQRLRSTAGKQDGLYWETPEGEPPSPAGPLLAEASGQGYATEGLDRKSQPYHGYLYRILKAQGATAKGGAKTYLDDGKLSGGVALVAYPAAYKVSGVMTFIINQDGVVYQKDLGEKTAEVAGAMTEYNPDSTWTKVKD